MMYIVGFSDQALSDIEKLHKLGQKNVIDKLYKLIQELKLHPRTGTGKPEQLKGDKNGLWSRRLTQKHRLIYDINDKIVTVMIFAAMEHYNDK